MLSAAPGRHGAGARPGPLPAGHGVAQTTAWCSRRRAISTAPLRNTASRSRSSSKGLAGRPDRDQLEAALHASSGPRRTDPRPRRRRREIAPADPARAREDASPSPCRPTASPVRSPTRSPTAATRRPPSSYSRRCSTTRDYLDRATRLAPAPSPEPDRRLPAPPGRPGTGECQFEGGPGSHGAGQDQSPRGCAEGGE